MPAFTATAPGKMILAGEHAVVYGQPAIAFPLPEIRARVIIEPKIKQPPGTVLFEAQDISVTGPSDSFTPDHAFNRILQVFQAYFHISQIPACLIRISSTIRKSCLSLSTSHGTANPGRRKRSLACLSGDTFPCWVRHLLSPRSKRQL